MSENIYFDGENHSIEDIDKPVRFHKLTGESDFDHYLIDKYKQNFFDTLCWRLTMHILEIQDNLSFWGIRKYAQVCKDFLSDLSYLSSRKDYESRMKKAIKNTKKMANFVVFDKVLNDLLFKPCNSEHYIDTLIEEAFQKDVLYWNNVLQSYKRKNAYINRLHYLVEQMNELNKLEIPCIQEAISNQMKQYQELLSQEA
jgi:hypothetical protein